MTKTERRRALMAQSKSDLPFEWDYTEGISPKLNTVGTGIVSMESNGLLLQGGSTLYSRGCVAPNIPTITESYKATITYSDLVANSSDGDVAFYHYHETEKRVCIARQLKGSALKTFVTNGASQQTVVNWNLANSGTVTIEYDSVAGTVKYSQGANTYTVTIGSTTAQTLLPRIAGASKGSSNSSVKIQHIKIERV